MGNASLERSGDIATLRIDRPRAMNSLDAETLSELRVHVQTLAREPARVVLVRSAGDRVFVAGADIAAMSKMSPEEARTFSELGHETFDALEALPSLQVAVVQGAALGGGCELLLSCDLAIASEKARFGQPETNLGLLPGFGGCSRLVRRIGLGAARDLIYSGRLIGAQEALAAGLVNKVVAPEELDAGASAWAAELASRPPLAVRRAKAAMAAAEVSDARTAARVEIEGFAGVFASDDCREGLNAFLEKRTPTFQGR
ncbi:MAG: enoyl-CoA hydratase-related protein [Candidatus Binatia bacterium]|nr:enoyl-CoA hydratase-related protein [Candidatus Binatia bacterium]